MYYFLDNSKLYIVDLENNIISKVNHEFDSNISQILYDDEFIYLLNRNNDCDIYVVDTNKVDKITYTIQEFNKYMDDSVDNRVKAIEDKYHVDLVYKEDVNIKDDTFTFKHITNNYVILDSLNTIENVLKKFNTEFFDSFKDKNHEKGLVIYLSGKLSPNDSVDTTSNPMGYTLYKDDSYAMIVDIESYALKNTICHELMHNIEHKIWDVFPYNEWYNNNPMYFSYMYTYKEDADTKFTMLDENKNLVCFVDQYSKSWPTEDIARIFENICSYDNHTQLLDYPHLKDKALLLKETIEKYFPSLKKSDVFNSLNE